jgi:hypothetical protein
MDKQQVILLVFAILAILYVLYNTFQVTAVPLEKGVKYTAGQSVHEPFTSSMGAPLDYGIGSYSNIKLGYPYQNSWRNDTQNIPLLKRPVFTGQGTPFPLKSSDSMQPIYPTMGPTVDGLPNSPTSMFMLKYNQSKPECCPSTFSTSTGCICLTGQQSDWINSRGSNNSAPSQF